MKSKELETAILKQLSLKIQNTVYYTMIGISLLALITVFIKADSIPTSNKWWLIALISMVPFSQILIPFLLFKNKEKHKKQYEKIINRLGENITSITVINEFESFKLHIKHEIFKHKNENILLKHKDSFKEIRLNHLFGDDYLVNGLSLKKLIDESGSTIEMKEAKV